MTSKKLERLTAELEELEEKRQERDRLQRRLEQIESELAEARSRKHRLEKRLEEEKEDVEDLKGISLDRFYHAMVGDKEDQLQKEKRDVVEAKSSYEEATRTVEDLEHQAESCRKNIKDLEDIESAYEEVLAQKENQLKQVNHPDTEKLAELSRRIASLRERKKELKESLDAGETVKYQLRQIKKQLDSAQDWGQHDMIWGGLFTTLAKHNKLDSAENMSRELQEAVRRYRRELEDLQNIEGDVGHIKVSGFEKFFDFFLDGFFVDWFVQSKINDALSRTRRLLAELGDQLQDLQNQKESMDQSIQTIEEKRKQIIRSA